MPLKSRRTKFGRKRFVSSQRKNRMCHRIHPFSRTVDIKKVKKGPGSSLQRVRCGIGPFNIDAQAEGYASGRLGLRHRRGPRRQLSVLANMLLRKAPRSSLARNYSSALPVKDPSRQAAYRHRVRRIGARHPVTTRRRQDLHWRSNDLSVESRGRKIGITRKPQSTYANS